MASVTDQQPASSTPAPAASRRRAALIATGLAVPVTVVLAFLFTAGSASTGSSASDKPLPAVTVPAPPTPDNATTAACASVFEKLPVQLAGQNPRRTDSDSGFVAAWGNPAIIIRCGVPKPVTTDSGSDEQPQFVNNVLWHVDLTKSSAIYTTIDRSVNIEVTVPAGQVQNQPLPLLSDAVVAIPAICTGIDAAGNQTPGLPVCPGSG